MANIVPIPEPFRMDSMGRLNSPAWVLWFKSLENSTDDISILSLSSADVTSQVSTVAVNPNDNEILCWLSF